MRRTLLLLLSAPLSLLGACGDTPVDHVVRSESKIFEMDRVYKSMFGPRDQETLTLLETDAPEVLWVTAIKAEIVGADGKTPESPEYFCHSVLNRFPAQDANRAKLLGPGIGSNLKLFTLVQGLPEIRFPEGFGMPVLSNDRFLSTAMAMNPLERPEPVRVGVNSRIEYVRESELAQKMNPLFLAQIAVRVPVEGSIVDHASHEHADAGSCVGPDDGLTTARSVPPIPGRANATIVSESGLQETVHWYVPPGRHVYRHRVDGLDSMIPFDTSAHYIASHLHPFGESLELIDVTTGKSVFKASAVNYPNRVALEKIGHYASREGIPIYSQHEYEIIAVYNNTTAEDVDSMAVMYLYLLDSAAKRAGVGRG